MTVTFHPMNLEAGAFPPPKVPVTPVLGSIDCGREKPVPAKSAFDDPGSVFLRSGRATFALILKTMGIGNGDSILMPAYHCGSMIESVIWAGVEPIFFRLHENLDANLDDIREALSKKPKALLLPHYFGFPQPLREAKEICRNNDMLLIEDCAHAYFGQSDLGVPVGMGGDFSVASVPKFFPTLEGGLLRVNRDDLHVTSTVLFDLQKQLRAFISPLDIAGRLGHGGFLAKAVARLLARMEKPESPGSEAEKHALVQNPDDEEYTYTWLVPEDVGLRGAFASRMYWRSVNRSAMAAARICNWNRISLAVTGLGGGEGLFDSLADGVVPYMYPLLLRGSLDGFVELKRRGVPIWRWEDLAVSDCPVASDYRERLLQIPCHQSITEQEMQWMIQQLCEVLGGPAKQGTH